MAAPIRRPDGSTAKIHEFKPAEREIANKLAPEDQKRFDALLAAERKASFRAGALVAGFVGLLLFIGGFGAGWSAYDGSVRATAKTLSEMAIQSQIARDVAAGQDPRNR